MNEVENKVPNCLGFIMDGNRRYAKEQGLDPILGHVAGKDKLIEVIKWTGEAKISHLVVYAFSTENWQRSEAEVEALMQLFSLVIEEFKSHPEKGFKVRFIGRKKDFSADLQTAMSSLEEDKGREGAALTLWIALSYGGRAEIVEAVNQAVRSGEEVTEESFAKLLWAADMPDPDLIVRTGGEVRLSNFLPWQSVYSELHFTPTYWPAFTKEEFNSILEIYAARERRKGK